VRNNTATLARTIESVQRQTYPNVEHIILDGASTDGTLDLIRKYSDRIDYFASEPDKGLYDAVNKAVPLAKGQLICILNSDDWLEPTAAEIAAHRMAGFDGAGLLLTGAQVQTTTGDVEWYPDFVHPGSYFKCANVCHNGIYATRAAFDISGPYDSSYKIAADFKWIVTSLDAGATFVYTREMTVNYSLGGVSGDGRHHSIECMRVVQERFPSLSEEEVFGLYHCFFVLQGNYEVVNPPANRTVFLRKLFANHSSDPDFLQALAWASLEKLEYPLAVPQAYGARAALLLLVRILKERIKVALHVAYRMAARAYSEVRQRQ
jgi:glycosyltransferase involved in cell wall biosynthesis